MKQQTKLNPEAKLEFTFIKVAEHEAIIREHDNLLKELFKLIAEEKINHFQVDLEADQDKAGDNISPGSPLIIQEIRE